MKVVLIAPDRPYLINQKALPPLALLYLADTLKKLGHEVEVLDFADGYRFVEADVYGVSVTTPDYQTSLKILNWLKRNGARRVICGGPHVSLCPQQCLDDGFDGVSIGDGELTLPRLLEGKRIVEDWAKDINDFYPDRRALNLQKYDFKVSGVPATSLLTARGCIWGNCAFCSRWDEGIRFCSAEHIRKELEDIRTLGFRAIMCYDDEFFMHPERDLEIIRALGEMGFAWRAFAHSRFLLRKEKLVEDASRNGLKEVLIGIESGSKEILENISKGTTPDENCKAIRLLQRYGVRVKGAFVIGLPGESWKTIGETERFIENCPCDDYDFSILQVYPGSAIYTHPEEYDLQFKPSLEPWKGKPGEYECSVATNQLSSRELLAIRKMFEDKFKKW